MKTDRQSSHSQCLQRPLVAISASWLKFGQSTPQNTEWSCFNSNNSNIWKIYKKKSWQKKRPRTILKLENVMTGEKCYPTTSFSDMRLWWQKQWLNNMHWQDKLKITKTNKTKKKPAFNSEHKPRKCNKRWVGVNEHYRTNRLKFSAKPQHKGSAWPQDWQLATNIVFSFHVTELYVKSIAHTLWDRKMTIKWNELVTAWKSGINNR